MDTLERIRNEITDRVAELRPLALEYERLQRAHAALAAGAEALDGVDRRRRAAQSSGRAAGRAPRGAARELILAAAREHPQAKRGEIATATGLAPTTVGTTLAKLRAEGLLPRPPRPRAVGAVAAEPEAAMGDTATDSDAAAETARPAAQSPPSPDQAREQDGEPQPDSAAGVDTERAPETPATPSSKPRRRRRAADAQSQ